MIVRFLSQLVVIEHGLNELSGSEGQPGYEGEFS